MKKKFYGLAVVALVALGGAGYWYWQSPGGLRSVSAVVEGRLAYAVASVPGMITDVYVKAGDVVERNQPLLVIDPSGYETRLAEERARLAELAARLPSGLRVPSPYAVQPAAPEKNLAALRQEEDSARKAMEAAAQEYASANIAYSRLRADANFSKPSLERQSALAARDEAAKALQQTREAFERASRARAQREAQDKGSFAGNTVSAALAAGIAEYQAQISRVRLAEQSLAATVITAPEAGRVLAQTARPNNMLAAGDTPVSILPDDSSDIRILAFFDKDDAENLAPGRECAVQAGDGGGILPGKIDAVQPPQNGEKNVAVRVILDKDAQSAGLRPEDEVTVFVRTNGPVFLDSLFGKMRKI